MMAKRFICAVIFLLCVMSVFPQEFATGGVFDPELYAQVPLRATTRDVTQLPPSASLKAYSPFPREQGRYGSCTAWATAYAARTISESVRMRRQDRTLTTNNAFSPLFVYRTISDDPTGERGIHIYHALDLMKDPGIPRRIMSETERLFETPLSDFALSRRYLIQDYARLFEKQWSTERGWHSVDPSIKIRPIKRALAEGRPVVINMYTPSSFHRVRSTEPWIP